MIDAFTMESKEEESLMLDLNTDQNDSSENVLDYETSICPSVINNESNQLAENDNSAVAAKKSIKIIRNSGLTLDSIEETDSTLCSILASETEKEGITMDAPQDAVIDCTDDENESDEISPVAGSIDDSICPQYELVSLIYCELVIVL